MHRSITRLGQLRIHLPDIPSVREEMRTNLIRMVKEKQRLFAALQGYDDTVIPQMINAVICGHNMIVLGERGQGKSRLIRSLTALLNEFIPAVAGCPIHDNPYAPVCRECQTRLAREGDDLEIAWIHRERRLIEKLATADVSTADLIGEVDPIRIAQGRTLDDESAIHFGLIPRANRGIFAINELPDLAEKIQVALFNVMEERDLQIKGFPVRLPLDLLLVATANPEDYTSRGRIITPLKDRFDAQIRTHYPRERRIEIDIMEQEARPLSPGGHDFFIPPFIKEIIAETTLQARTSPDISQHSGVSCRMSIRSFEAIMGSALRRCLLLSEHRAVPRITDLDAVYPAIVGKLEIEYAGEEKELPEIIDGLLKRAIKLVFDEHCSVEQLSSVISSFNNGMGAEVSQLLPSHEYMDGLKNLPGLHDAVASLVDPQQPAEVASAIEFILEGLHLSNRLNKEIMNNKLIYREAKAQGTGPVSREKITA